MNSQDPSIVPSDTPPPAAPSGVPGGSSAPAETGYGQMPYGTPPAHPPGLPPQEGQPLNKQRFKLGVAALVLGIASVVLAVIPIVNFAVGVVGLAGIIVSIVALTRKGRPKRAAVWGLVLSIVGSLLAAVLAVVYSMSILGAVFDELEAGEWEVIEEDSGETDGEAVGGDELAVEGDEQDWVFNEETGEWEPDEGDISDGTPEAAEPVVVGELTDDGVGVPEGHGTEENPLPPGSPIRIMGLSDFEYAATVGTTTLNANDLVAQIDTDNPPPPAGMQYIAVEVTVALEGEARREPSFTLNFLTAEGEEAPPGGDLQGLKGVNTQFKDVELDSGESHVETFVRLVPEGDHSEGMWILTQPFWTVDYYFAAQ